MLRTALLVTSLVLLLGCGGQESSDAGKVAGKIVATETPDTAAPARSPMRSATGAMKAETPAEVAPPSPGATVHPQVQGCLDLIGQGEFSQALPVCLEAARLDPTNMDVQAALAKAKTEMAGLDAATGAAKQAAEGAAMGAAVPKLETPKPAMPKLPGASN